MGQACFHHRHVFGWLCRLRILPLLLLAGCSCRPERERELANLLSCHGACRLPLLSSTTILNSSSKVQTLSRLLSSSDHWGKPELQLNHVDLVIISGRSLMSSLSRNSRSKDFQKLIGGGCPSGNIAGFGEMCGVMWAHLSRMWLHLEA